MTRQATITMEEVIKAIESLQAGGKPINQANVRSVLGRGSNTTIAVFLREWRKTVPLPEPPQAEPPTKEQLAVVQQMNEAAAQRALEAQRELEAQIKDLHSENNDLVENQKEAEKERDSAIYERDAMKDELDKAKEEAAKKIKEAEGERDKMAAKLEADQAARAEFKAEVSLLNDALRNNMEFLNKALSGIQLQLDGLKKSTEHHETFFKKLDALSFETGKAKPSKTDPPKSTGGKKAGT